MTADWSVQEHAPGPGMGLDRPPVQGIAMGRVFYHPWFSPGAGGMDRIPAGPIDRRPTCEGKSIKAKEKRMMVLLESRARSPLG